ncbi:MAG: hypothetical protein ACLFWD_06340, partial [Anaerolineales bacterium]
GAVGAGGNGGICSKAGSVTDTQWPRYYVFKQDTPESRHESCGTVHAPDLEMALQTARDVFVRRPECFSLWVAPAAKVLARTGEQWDLPFELPEDAEKMRPFLIFARPNQRDPHRFQLELQAPHAEAALRAFYERDPELARLGTLALRRASIKASEPEDEAAWFKPARSKPYRHSSFYHPDQLLRRLKGKEGVADGD